MQTLLLNWFKKVREPHPWRADFMRTQDPYFVWISEVMLQQTTLAAVTPKYRDFVAQFPSLYDVAAADPQEVRLACRGLGYYRRFEAFKKAADLLCAQHPETMQWPSSQEAWLELPGVGEYTASAIGSIAFAWPLAVLDGNVERVLCRLLKYEVALDEPGVKKELKKAAKNLLNVDQPGAHNEAMMELGQKICTPLKPACSRCPLTAKCLSKGADNLEQIPRPRKKAEKIDIDLALLLITDRRGRIALVRRPKAARFLGGSLGLPTLLRESGLTKNSLKKPSSESWSLDDKRLGIKRVLASKESPKNQAAFQWLPKENPELARYRHSITKFKISAHVFQADISDLRGLDLEVECWLDAEMVEQKLLANLDRKGWLAARKNKKLFIGQNK